MPICGETISIRKSGGTWPCHRRNDRRASLAGPRARRPLGLRDRAGTGRRRRGGLRPPAGLPPGRRAQRRRQPVEGGRPGDGGIDGDLLRPALAAAQAADRGAAEAQLPSTAIPSWREAGHGRGTPDFDKLVQRPSRRRHRTAVGTGPRPGASNGRRSSSRDGEVRSHMNRRGNPPTMRAWYWSRSGGRRDRQRPTARHRHPRRPNRAVARRAPPAGRRPGRSQPPQPPARPARSLAAQGGRPVPDRGRLNRPAYLYLFWVGSDGKVSPIYPWKPGHWESGRPRSRRSIVSTYRGSRQGLGDPDRETGDRDAALAGPGRKPTCRGRTRRISPSSCPTPVFQPVLIKEAVWLENGREITLDTQDRAVPSTKTRKSDDPVLRIRRLLSDKVQPLGDYYQAIVFPNQGGK